MNLAWETAVAAVIIPIFTAVFKPSRPQTKRELNQCFSALWGKQLPPCLLLEVQDPSLGYTWWVCVPWVGVAREIWNHCASSAMCFCDRRPSPGLEWGLLALVLVQWKSSFIKLREMSVGKGEAVAMHNLPPSSVQPWISRPFSPVHLPRWTQTATLTSNSYPKSTRNCVLAPTPSVLLFRHWGRDVFDFLPLLKFKELCLVPQCQTSAWFYTSGTLDLCVCKVLNSHWKFSMWLWCLQLDFLLSFSPYLVRIKFTVQFLCSWKTLSTLWNFVCHRGWWTFVWISWLFWPFPEIWHKQDELTNLIPEGYQD